MQRLKKIAVGAAALLVAIQLAPIRGSNPPVTGEPPMSPEVREILARSCFDCHSNRTEWPWYSQVAPVSWWIVHHVDEGREHLNFSAWDTLPAEDRREAGEEIVEEVEEGKMPLATYVVGHPGAQLSDQDRQRLLAWARSLGAENGAPPPGREDTVTDR